MIIKRFKQHLQEGAGQVKKKYVDTGKMSIDDLRSMETWLKTAVGDEKLKMIEWVADYWLSDNDNKLKIMRKNGVNFKSALNKGMSIIFEMRKFLSVFVELKNRKVIKGELPKNMKVSELNKWVNDKSNQYYSKKKMKIPSGLKKGHDYEEVWSKDGIQVFKIMTFKASEALGAGCNWCVKREKQTWHDYTVDQELSFYFVRNHRLNSSNVEYKLAVVVDSRNTVYEVYDRDDNRIISSLKEMLEDELKIPMKIFKHFEANDADEYEDSRLEEIREMVVYYDNLIEEIENYQNEREEKEKDFDDEVERKQKQRVKDLMNEVKNEKDENKKEELEQEADWIERLGIEEYYEKYEGKYYSDDKYERSDPSWFPEAYDELVDWWVDMGGHSRDEIRDQIMYAALDQSYLKLTDPNTWM